MINAKIKLMKFIHTARITHHTTHIEKYVSKISLKEIGNLNFFINSINSHKFNVHNFFELWRNSPKPKSLQLRLKKNKSPRNFPSDSFPFEQSSQVVQIQKFKRLSAINKESNREMSSTEYNIGLQTDKASSRVLRPPVSKINWNFCCFGKKNCGKFMKNR